MTEKFAVNSNSLDLKKKSIVTNLAAIALLLVLFQWKLPLWPIPITGQTLGCLWAGLWFSSSWNFRIFVSYIILGCLGLPLFLTSSGGYLSPSFGYILGFPIISVLMAHFRPYIRGVGSFYFFALLADLPCLLLGALYLNIVLGWAVHAWVSGFLVFLPGEFLKVTLLYGIWKSFSRITEKSI